MKVTKLQFEKLVTTPRKMTAVMVMALRTIDHDRRVEVWCKGELVHLHMHQPSHRGYRVWLRYKLLETALLDCSQALRRFLSAHAHKAVRSLAPSSFTKSNKSL